MSRNKKYIPSKRNNPILQAKEIERLSKRLKEQDNLIQKYIKDLEAVQVSHNQYISLLGNFAQHDIKNSIQSIDSLISSADETECNKEIVSSIKSYLEYMRIVLKNFYNLTPHSSGFSEYNLSVLLKGCKALNRNIFKKNNITLDISDKKDITYRFSIPFHSLFQMMLNLIMNASTHLINNKINSPYIFIKSDYDDKYFYLYIGDNGLLIEENNKEKIFEYGFSTTGGTGIGLYHARYICDLFNGKIEVINETMENNLEINKYFLITLPLDKSSS